MKDLKDIAIEHKIAVARKNLEENIKEGRLNGNMFRFEGSPRYKGHYSYVKVAGTWFAPTVLEQFSEKERKLIYEDILELKPGELPVSDKIYTVEVYHCDNQWSPDSKEDGFVHDFCMAEYVTELDDFNDGFKVRAERKIAESPPKGYWGCVDYHEYGVRDEEEKAS